jgi:Zn finger protein HypA/HybF involved in hydrogenase expression
MSEKITVEQVRQARIEEAIGMLQLIVPPEALTIIEVVLEGRANGCWVSLVPNNISRVVGHTDDEREWFDEKPFTPCPTCHRTGQVDTWSRPGEPTVSCPTCGGSGSDPETFDADTNSGYPCPTCGEDELTAGEIWGDEEAEIAHHGLTGE